MAGYLTSVGARRLFGDLVAGVLFVVAGLYRIAGAVDAVGVAVSVLCMAAMLVSIYGSFSKKRERADEMYWANVGQASHMSFIVTGIALCCLCLVGLATKQQVDICGAAFVVLGILKASNGMAFMYYERRDGACADD